VVQAGEGMPPEVKKMKELADKYEIEFLLPAV
jgi:hypothetical protein